MNMSPVILPHLPRKDVPVCPKSLYSALQRGAVALLLLDWGTWSIEHGKKVLVAT
jgi:hypothetical protein